MRTFKYKGKIITASSKKEAIKKITAIESINELTDELYLKFGREYLEGKDGEVYSMDDLDSIVSSSTEAIRLYSIGHDYPNVPDNFNLSRDYFTFYKRNGGLMSIDSSRLLDYLKLTILSDEFLDWLNDNNKV